MNTMTYKCYVASIVYSDDDECYIGRIAGIKDWVGFHGESVAELKEAFHEAAEDYLETCETVDKEPQKSYSGRLMLRILSELHTTIATAAQVIGQSINRWISRAFKPNFPYLNLNMHITKNPVDAVNCATDFCRYICQLLPGKPGKT